MQIKLSRSDWEDAGVKMGWIKRAGTDSTDVSGNMESMARQQAEERYGEDALERVRRDREKMLRERGGRGNAG